LYSRTNDFYREFAEALSLADEVYLTEIYPARELPMPGVTSQLIYDAMSDGVKKQLVEKDNVLELVKQEEFDLLVILGAGDLDNQMGDIAAILSARA
jgi:UDP-N-acetylmuramate--alanine ligase